MLDQTFSTKNLRALLGKRDFIKFKLVKKDQAYISVVEQISENINNGSYFDQGFDVFSVGGKDIFNAKTLHNTLALRKVNDNIRRLYKVSQSDRLSCVKRISRVLEDTVPIYVIKLDIKDFYESIENKIILKKLYSDNLLSHQSKNFLKELFSRSEFSTIMGLPRGLSISSTMSEIFMRDLDQFISGMDGVYLYTRYVDDLIIFSHTEASYVVENVESYLINNMGMNLNKDKSQKTKINCDCKNLCKCTSPKKCNILCECSKCDEGIHFDYLGYCFEVKPKSNRRIPGKPIISLSKSKVNKYKNRICLSFVDFIKNKNFELLEKRIKFMTGNFHVDPTDKEKNLKAGIYYNYQLINDTSALELLDVFYRKTLFAKNGTLGKKLELSMTRTQRRKLVKYSFHFGFEKRIFHKFSRGDMSQIKECWKK